MPNAKRKLKDIEVMYISLVDKAANKKTIIYKSDDPEKGADFNLSIEIKKYDDEKHLVYGIVYAPDEVDTDGDTAAADVIEKAAYRFMKQQLTRNVDRMHDYEGWKYGYVAESWIVKEKDPLFDTPGAWAVAIKVEDDDTWAKVKKGEINGLSMAGRAHVEYMDKSDSSEKGFIKWLKNTFIKEVNKMDKEEVQKMIDDTLTKKSEEIEKNVTKAVTESLSGDIKKISDTVEKISKSVSNPQPEPDKENLEKDDETKEKDKDTEKDEKFQKDSKKDEPKETLENRIEKLEKTIDVFSNVIISKAQGIGQNEEKKDVSFKGFIRGI